MKKILTLLLLSVMTAAFMGFTAFAEETAENPKLTDNANSWRYENGQPITNMYDTLLLADESYHPDATLTGIDVSKHQGVIDWEKVKAAGIDFAIIRCGYAEDKTEYDDTRWHYNASECERLGIPYGVYLYSYAFNVAEAESEADHVLRLIEGYNPSLPVYYDMEDNSTLEYDHVAMAHAFCQKISDAGYPVGIYASKYWWLTYLKDPSLDKWYRWVAQWNTECNYNGRYEIWQYYNKGRVDGINTDVDMNFLIGYPEDHGVVAGAKLTGMLSDGGMPALSWNSMSGAGGYKVYRSEQRNSGYTAVDTSAAGYVDTSAEMGKTYYYKVKAVYPNGSYSGSSNIVEITTMLAAPEVTVTSDVISGKPALKWKRVNNAYSYEIYRKSASEKEYTLNTTSNSTYYTDNSAQTGTVYYYQVRAVYRDDVIKSAFSTAQSMVCRLPAVNVRLAVADGTNLSWTPVEQATGYNVYRASEWNGEYRLINTTDGNTFTDMTGADTDFYRIEAVYRNSNANSAHSVITGRNYTQPAVTLKIINTSAEGTAQASWQKVEAATGYEVYCATSRYGKYKLVSITTDTSFANPEAREGRTYYYRVKAVYCPKVHRTVQ